jgi:hypothetical protein
LRTPRRCVRLGQRAVHLGTRRGVGKQLVGLDHLLEDPIEQLAKRADFAPEVAIRVELLGEAEVGALDRLGVGAGRNAEHFVIGLGEARLEGDDPLLVLFRYVERGIDVDRRRRRLVDLGRRWLVRRRGFDLGRALRVR